MKRWMFGALVGAMGLCGASAAAAADARKVQAALIKAFEASEREDCPAALKLLKPQLKPKAAAQLDAEVAAAAYHLAAFCAVRTRGHLRPPEPRSNLPPTSCGKCG